MTGIVDYNMGNIQSVLNAFQFIGEPVKVVRDGETLSKVDRIVLPGVGAFGHGMEHLHKQGLLEALHREVLVGKKPFLGICLGIQLICKESFEFGQHRGLGWIDAEVRRLKDQPGLRIPHVGWNNLSVRKDNPLLDPSEKHLDVYFVHSFCLAEVDREYCIASCEYGQPFVAALQKDNIFAVQFHPEKSQQPGLNILKRFSALPSPCLNDA